ncbi:hypothetical protein NEILACOT_04095 [Neisseria lactamica ATCC 23970]|uniref:Uncharacterized protein n=2 Tax=Neisseria lactamica TaxID=486 RepID=D0W987_NEILA|nr:hypothetical protein NEILACOT_04095 [Neisseria lactamica ATCC 23970]KFJ36134.1 hypothetical protein DR91_995 [Neisseria lactamica ATCC 23970]VTQ48847.1 Uncharacterised protein [Neisseria lactamica]
MWIFCNTMKNKQIKLFADVGDSDWQTFIVPDKSGSAGITGGFVPVGKKPAVFETSVRFGADRVVIRGCLSVDSGCESGETVADEDLRMALGIFKCIQTTTKRFFCCRTWGLRGSLRTVEAGCFVGCGIGAGGKVFRPVSLFLTTKP